MDLKEYESKRDFKKTPEPEPGTLPGAEGLVFVVHKHAARNLHYDLRLELDGVLKSWAVPKGPSMDPSSKRLAMMVEDHPFDYKDFEGVIPEGNYGAGSVIIWDRGYYHHPLAKNGKENGELLKEGLEKGDLKFILHGEKLHGQFALVKIRSDEKSWLLLKKKDQYVAGEEVLKENRSVLSNRTLDEVARDAAGTPLKQEKLDRVRIREVMEKEDLKDAPLTPMPHRLEPMLATLVKEPFDKEDWIFEVKWDGYRALAEIRDEGISLYSRNGLSLNKKFKPVADALDRFGFEALLDGEVVVVDDQGYPNFQMLQNYEKSRTGHLIYYVFDLLHFNGHDLTGLPLIRRKDLLKQVLPSTPLVKLSDHVWKEGTLFFNVVKEKGLEGVMAKYSRSLYRPGKRSRHWLKVKTHLTQEAVIAGFTEPKGGRENFGALVLGVFDGNDLVYAGHLGTGFGTDTLKELRRRLEPLIVAKSPFREEPKTNTPVTWVKPELVLEAAFQSWTGEGLMRQPVFVRLREDKEAKDVVREDGSG